MRLSTEFVRWLVETLTTLTESEIRQVVKFEAENLSAADLRKVSDHLLKLYQATRAL